MPSVEVHKELKYTPSHAFEAAYCQKAVALISAHLMGIPVPEEIKDEYLFVLMEAPRLLDVMIDGTLSRERFAQQGIQLIQVKQAIVQNCWPFESKLKQLPHWTVGLDKYLRAKNSIKVDHGPKGELGDLLQLNMFSPKELDDVLMNAYGKGTEDMSYLIESPKSGGGKGKKNKSKGKGEENERNEEGTDDSHTSSALSETPPTEKGKGKENDASNAQASDKASIGESMDFLPAGSLVNNEEDAVAMVRMYPC